MDAFFAAAELLRHPELRGQPVVVGGSGRRGVIAAASYEARWFGVRSAMPSSEAKRRCPQAVFLPGDHSYYHQISEQVMAAMRKYTPLIEPLSLDEAFLDVTAGRRLFGSGAEIAARIRTEIYDDTGLWASAGVARSKFLAKLASETAKPQASKTGPVMGAGVHVVAPGDEIAFLHPLPARALWGVGPATMTKLERLGVETVADVAALPRDTLVSALGRSMGHHLHELSHARDGRPVQPIRQAKSISQEETFQFDKRDIDELRVELLRLCDAVAGRLRRSQLQARTVTLKIRFGDFRTLSRNFTFETASDSAAALHRQVCILLDQIDISGGVRLLGVGVVGLVEPQPQQLTLDDVGNSGAGPGETDRRDAELAIDAIRQRFGVGAIGPASLIKPGDGLDTRTRNERPWG